MTESKIGVFSSWEIISPDKAVKHCDKSVFNRLGSSVPKPTRWFWGIAESPINTRKKITYRYKEKDFQGSVNIYSNDLSQIYWEHDLKASLDFIIDSDSFPDMVFERIGEDYYNVSFLNTSNNAAALESILVLNGDNEGKVIQYYTTKYERSTANRSAAIKIHGTKCMACGFDFEATYGELGKNYIEVHHTKPLFSLEQETTIIPETDLVCLCSNCHRMIHRKRDDILSLAELQSIIAEHTGKRH